MSARRHQTDVDRVYRCKRRTAGARGRRSDVIPPLAGRPPPYPAAVRRAHRRRPRPSRPAGRAWPGARPSPSGGRAGRGSRPPCRPSARRGGRRARRGAGRRGGSTSRRWRAAGGPRARARSGPAAVRPRACSIAARSNSGSTDSGLRSGLDAGDARGGGRRAGVEPVERGVAGVHGADGLPCRPRGGEREGHHQRGGDPGAGDGQAAARGLVGIGGAARAARRGRRRRGGHRLEPEPRAQRAAPGDPARAQQRAARRWPGRTRSSRSSECTPKTSTTVASVASADALGVPGQPAVAPPQPERRAAARQSQAHSASSESGEADPAEVGERLHDVAVRVADGERVGAVARARGRVGAGAGADPRADRVDLERLVASSGRAPRTSRSGGSACWRACARWGR